MNAHESSKVPAVVIGLLLAVVAALFLITANSQRGSFFDTPVSVTSLKVGINEWLGYEPLHLAYSLGYYENSPVRLIEYASATQVIRAFRNNAIHVATLTLDEVLLLLEVGLDVRIILVVDVSNGGDAVVAKPEIVSLGDIKGHRVGVESTALGAFLLTRALDSVGLEVSDVIVVRSEIDEQERVFLRGDFDAVVTYEPVRSRLLAAGAHEVFDSSKIPGEIVDVLVVSAQTLELYPEKIEALLKGWFRALDYIKLEPKVAAGKIAPRLNLSTEEVLGAYEGLVWPGLEENLKFMTGPEAPILKTLNKLANEMLKRKLLQSLVVPAGLVVPPALNNTVGSE